MPYKKYHGILGQYFLPLYNVPGYTMVYRGTLYHGKKYRPKMPWYFCLVYSGTLYHTTAVYQ